MSSDSEDEIFFGPITLKEIKKEFPEFEQRCKTITKTEMNTSMNDTTFNSIIEISSTENFYDDMYSAVSENQKDLNNSIDMSTNSNFYEVIEIYDSSETDESLTNIKFNSPNMSDLINLKPENSNISINLKDTRFSTPLANNTNSDVRHSAEVYYENLMDNVEAQVLDSEKNQQHTSIHDNELSGNLNSKVGSEKHNEFSKINTAETFLNHCKNLLDLSITADLEKISKDATNTNESLKIQSDKIYSYAGSNKSPTTSTDNLVIIDSHKQIPINSTLNCSSIILRNHELLENSTQTNESYLLNSEYSFNKTENATQTETDQNSLQEANRKTDIVEDRWNEAIALSDATLLTEQTEIKTFSLLEKTLGNSTRNSGILKTCESECNDEPIWNKPLTEEIETNNLSVTSKSLENSEILKNVLSKQFNNEPMCKIAITERSQIANSSVLSNILENSIRNSNIWETTPESEYKSESEYASLTTEKLQIKNISLLQKSLGNSTKHSDMLETTGSECNNTLEEIERLLALEEKYNVTNNKIPTEMCDVQISKNIAKPSKNYTVSKSSDISKLKTTKKENSSKIPRTMTQTSSLQAKKTTRLFDSNKSMQSTNKKILMKNSAVKTPEVIGQRTNKLVEKKTILSKKKLNMVPKQQVSNKENIDTKLSIAEKKIATNENKVPQASLRLITTEENACSPITSEVNKLTSAFDNRLSNSSMVDLKTTLHRQLSNLSIDTLPSKESTPMKTIATPVKSKDIDKQFKTPTITKVLKPNKTPATQSRKQLPKNIVSPIGMYINKTPQAPLVVKIRQPSRKKFFIESQKKTENNIEPSTSVAGRSLPFCAYKSASHVQVVEENTPAIPKSIKKYFSPVLQCVIKHESRIKSHDIIQSPRTRKLPNSDDSSADLLNNSQAIFNASLDTSEVSFRIKKPALRPN